MTSSLAKEGKSIFQARNITKSRAFVKEIFEKEKNKHNAYMLKFPSNNHKQLNLWRHVIKKKKTQSIDWLKEKKKINDWLIKQIKSHFKNDNKKKTCRFRLLTVCNIIKALVFMSRIWFHIKFIFFKSQGSPYYFKYDPPNYANFILLEKIANHFFFLFFCEWKIEAFYWF